MTTPATAALAATCPVPLSHRTEITVGHGGGRLTQELIAGISAVVTRPGGAAPAAAAPHTKANSSVSN